MGEQGIFTTLVVEVGKRNESKETFGSQHGEGVEARPSAGAEATCGGPIGRRLKLLAEGHQPAISGHEKSPDTALASEG